MKNYFGKTLWLSILVVMVLLVCSLLPIMKVGDVEFRRINILSRLISDSTIDAWMGYDADSLWQMADSKLEVAELSDVASVFTEVHRVDDSTKVQDFVTDIKKDSMVQSIMVEARSGVLDGVTPIEDYGRVQGGGLEGFFRKLNSGGARSRPLRIAFMGDSFIESDIITSDFRRMLQDQFGGSGVGFAQISSEQAPFNRNIKHKWNGWNRVSAMKGAQGQAYLPSLITYTPRQEGCFVEWSMLNKKNPKLFYRTAKLLFTNKGNSVVTALINGTVTQRIVMPTRGDSLESLTIVVPDSLGSFQSLRLSFSNVTGLKLYGALLEDNHGVVVDNYSVRGNSGLVLSRIDASMSNQFQKLHPTDLVIISYGLNVVEANVVNYNDYIKKMNGCVSHLRRAMPGVQILMLSVSDRSMRNSSGDFVTMRGVVALEAAQRELAQNMGIGFWSTYRAMRAMGGMEQFVKNGWAASDYTHIGMRGGCKMANALFDAMMAEKVKYNKVQTKGLIANSDKPSLVMLSAR